MKRFLIPLLLLILPLALVACGGDDDDDAADATATADASASASAEAHDGHDAASGELSLSLGRTQAARAIPQPSGEMMEPEHGAYVVVEVFASNPGDEPAELARSGFQLTDADGQQYEPALYISQDGTDHPDSLTVDAATDAAIALAFDVPEDAGALTLTVPTGDEFPLTDVMASLPPEAPQFDAPGQVIDAAANDYKATVTTARGAITIDLFEDVAPNTVNNFVFLAQQGYFDGITFHRIVPGFVVQSGDPTGTGSGGPGYLVDEEPNDLVNKRGTLSMAKTSGATAFGSQWFINLADNTMLDETEVQGGRFYVFGEVTEGMDIVDQLQQGDTIESITIEELPK